ncbi:E3 ubiquitin-protein ligase Rnf220 isoform X1 [Cherax quadricarinatus]
MEAHFTQELDKMVRLPQSRPLAQRTPTAPACTSPTPSTSTEGYSNTPTAKPRPANSAPRHGEGWKTYQRVRNNRQLRVRVKRPRTLVDLDGEEGMTCPVCDLRVPLDGPGDINTHIDKCLRAAERECEEAAEVDVEGEYEEYEWCGQTRVRATQMLRAEGQLHALGTRVVQGREDEVVEVCEDDSLSVYGPAQYTDTDLQPHNHLAHTNTDHDVDVGDLVDTTTTLHTPQAPTDHIPSSSSNSLAPEEPASGSSSSNSHCSVNSAHSLRAEGESANNPAVVEALRARLQELEEETPRARYSCRVCHGEYVRPLVSVSCWHVHCQQCWLPALAAKKLCPQCSVITAPGDLRRVYL